MLFRTKFLMAFIALAAVAIGSASLLIVSAQRNEVNQQRTNFAHESLSGYFMLSGTVFRTFKQARRDLVSGDGTFAFDFAQSAQEIQTTLDHIARTLNAEAALSHNTLLPETMVNLAALQSEVTQALTDIRTASDMILGGQPVAGRQKAIEVLQGQVDVEIASLIQEAIIAQRAELASAQQEIRIVQKTAQTTAWVAALIAVLLSGVIFVTLLRRFQSGLRALEAGAKAYTGNDLSYAIDLPGQDELSAVARSFTAMAGQMQIKQDALIAARLDLEERVAARTAALSAANAELRESDRLRRQFFADIGHELRTPVSAIRGEAEVALRARTGRAEAQEAALATIVSISEELTTTVGDLFLIAREQAGVLDFRKDQIDLRHAVALGVEQMQSLLGERQATIATDTLSGGPLRILGDTPRIAQLVRILISNALEHTQNGVTIDVVTKVEGADAVLCVSDNGPGIPEQDWSRIFDRFVKGSGRPAPAAQGTGLGLAIARSITTAHGGAIAVRIGARGGAELSARFPLITGNPGQ